MTDNKIIKALECCTDESYENCNECPYSIDTLSCERIKLLEDSLDLINRKQAEIERLEKVLNGRDQLVNALNKCYKQAKSEAVKEFVDKMKKYIDVGHLRPPTEICFSELDVVKMIDKTAEEMVGDTE